MNILIALIIGGLILIAISYLFKAIGKIAVIGGIILAAIILIKALIGG